MFDLLPAYLKILSHHTAKDMFTPIFSFYFTGEITRKIPEIKIVRNIVDSRLHNDGKDDIMK